MFQLRNRSPFEAMIFAAPDRRGVDNLVVVVQASFALGPPLSVAAEQRPIAVEDRYAGDPAHSSLREPSEVYLHKPGTDVILIGEACAPRGQPVVELDVGLRVGGRCRYLRVFGDRRWTPGRGGLVPSYPEPFVRMPVVYERAFGGGVLGEGPALPENPVGVGWLGGRDPNRFLGQPVPNIEDPAAPLQVLGQSPAPAGFGAIASSWAPRVQRAGTYDARWAKQRAPFLPEDYDPRFASVAAPGLHFDAGLEGGEAIVALGFDPDQVWEFRLPRCGLALSARVRGQTRALAPELDTVLIEPNEERLSMTWHARLAVGEDLLRVQRVDVAMASLEGAGDVAHLLDSEGAA